MKRLLIKKTLLWSLGVTGALIIFIFIFGSLDPLPHTIAKQAPIIRVESVPATPAVLSKENITGEIAKQIAQELVAKNPNGPKSGEQVGLETVNPDELVQKTLDKAFANVNLATLRPEVKTSDLTIVASSKPELDEVYFNSLNQIFTTYFPKTLEVNWAEPAKTDFIAFDSAFNASIAELYQVKVPSALVPLHKDAISLLGALRSVFALIKNYERDPFQAALAIEAGDQFGLELAQIFAKMDAYIRSRNLLSLNR